MPLRTLPKQFCTSVHIRFRQTAADSARGYLHGRARHRPRQAGDFTPWLATDENVSLLGDSIGIELEVEAQEKDVGPFRADILCRDTRTGEWVLIENQLVRTDHGHLGQLITYAAGLKAVTIVWIAARFTEEHRAALDWLNETTDEQFRFFALEVEAWFQCGNKRGIDGCHVYVRSLFAAYYRGSIAVTLSAI